MFLSKLKNFTFLILNSKFLIPKGKTVLFATSEFNCYTVASLLFASSGNWQARQDFASALIKVRGYSETLQSLSLEDKNFFALKKKL